MFLPIHVLLTLLLDAPLTASPSLQLSLLVDRNVKPNTTALTPTKTIKNSIGCRLSTAFVGNVVRASTFCLQP